MNFPFLIEKLFSLSGQVAVITGGAGLLGPKHAEVIAAAGGFCILADLNGEQAEAKAAPIAREYEGRAAGMALDITDHAAVEAFADEVERKHGPIGILINNAANNPKMEAQAGVAFSRVENFPMQQWDADMNVGLRGAFICTQLLGACMAKRGKGTIINISSEYGLNAPDQRLYRQEGVAEDAQPVKPVTYTVVKSGLLGMTKYFATYWADSGVRCNAITVAGVQNGQPESFVQRYVSMVPLGRMAQADDYQGAILFLASAGSNFVNGANLVVDGGKSCW